MKALPSTLLLAGFLLTAPSISRAQETSEPLAKGIQDNSFLIEEAYNQEPGVVQHILTARRQGRDWTLNFTQEWPLGSQAHQFSYTVPYAFLRSSGSPVQGVGDVYLNYRYQAMEESASRPAFAPRISLIVPSGSERKGIGAGSAGYQINLPFSKVVSDRVTLHANAGATAYLDVLGRTPLGYNLGGSAIYALSRNFNLMLEVLGERNESVDFSSAIQRELALTVSPGVRFAFNLEAGQLVGGLAAPIRMTKEEKPSVGAFLYLSFEHKFGR